MMNKWKYPAILLTGIGIANIGDWIYLIALNLIVLNETQSPMAVVLLYLLKPAAGMVVNAWSGSLIDRVNKRNLMIILDLSTGCFNYCSSDHAYINTPCMPWCSSSI